MYIVAFSLFTLHCITLLYHYRCICNLEESANHRVHALTQPPYPCPGVYDLPGRVLRVLSWIRQFCELSVACPRCVSVFSSIEWPTVPVAVLFLRLSVFSSPRLFVKGRDRSFVLCSACDSFCDELQAPGRGAPSPRCVSQYAEIIRKGDKLWEDERGGGGGKRRRIIPALSSHLLL